MKRADLIRRIERLGFVLIRHGGKHDWYQNPVTKVSQPIPRHREITESLAKYILKNLGS
jgi:mRNA interferase HicA